MPVVKKSALVAFSSEQMFDLVNDVASYPRFLPWCHASRILTKTEEKTCAEIVVARIGIRQKFSTCNLLHPYERIDIKLKEGPFTRLDGYWRFSRLRKDACKVELLLKFEFSGKMIDKAFGTIFNQIANTLVDSFCKRAIEIYDNR